MHFNGGYLGVEFFFIVSGYLLMGRVSNDKDDANPAKRITVVFNFEIHKIVSSLSTLKYNLSRQYCER